MSSNTSVATVSGSTVTIVGVGTTTITANQAAAGNYTSGSTAATLTVGARAPTLGAMSAINKNYGDIPFSLTAPSSNSSGAIIYASNNPAVATISGNTVTIVGAGTATITATQAASGNYLSGTATAMLTVASIAPTVGSFTAMNKTFGDAPFTLSPPSSNSSGAFTYTSNNTGVATISGNMVTLLAAGTTTITALQAASGGYSAASTSTTLTVNAGTPTVAPTLSGFSSVSKSFGDPNFSLTQPVSNSAGTISYTSSNPAVATVSGTVVTIVGLGQSTITATQAALGNYTSGSISSTLTVAGAVPSLGALGTSGAINKTYGDIPFTINAPSSNSVGSFTYISNNTSVATVSGSTITIVGVGTSTITATQAAAGNYVSGSATATLTVVGAAPTLGTFEPINKTAGDPSFSLTAPASNSSGQFTYVSSNPSVATVSGSTITVVAAGTSTITALQAASGGYAAASATAMLTVSGGVSASAPTIGSFAALTKTYGNSAFNLTAPASNSAGAFSYSSSDTSVATVSGSTVTIVGRINYHNADRWCGGTYAGCTGCH